jgi:hypothetical protein
MNPNRSSQPKPTPTSAKNQSAGGAENQVKQWQISTIYNSPYNRIYIE